MAAIRRVPLRFSHMPLRLASTNNRPALEYKGRIARPAPPPGPGETSEADSSVESEQAHQAVVDAINKSKEEDYKKRYNSTFRKWMGIIIASPIALVVTPYLFKRVFLGEERKRLITEVDDESDLDD